MGKISIWRGTAGDGAFPALDDDVEADVAIVGGGITGVTLAMLLREAGKSVVVLEAHAIGLGSTGNSTGNLYETVSERLYAVGDKWDRATLGAVVQSRREAVGLIERTVQRLGADCGFRRCPLYLYATRSEEVEVVEKEFRAASDIGLPARLAHELPTRLKSELAFVLEDQAQFHPLAYLRAVAGLITSARCRIYEHSAVVTIDEDGRRVHTAHGSVRARDIVLATHTPKGIYLTHAELVPHREYGVGMRLASGRFPDGIFWGLGEQRHSLRGVRTNGGEYLVVIGESHRTGEEPDGDGPWQRLETFAGERFGVAGGDYRWSAQNYHAADTLPYIGRSYTSDVYIATGFATDGLAWGTLAAGIIADQIIGRPNRWSELYRANRLAPVKAARGVLAENLSVAKSLLRDYARRPTATLDEIPRGGGAVVEVDGERVAAYRDGAGELSLLSPVCPHMKCIVHWNDAEQSWDCPCHGSRFDITGEVLEGPALSPLARRLGGG